MPSQPGEAMKSRVIQIRQHLGPDTHDLEITLENRGEFCCGFVGLQVGDEIEFNPNGSFFWKGLDGEFSYQMPKWTRQPWPQGLRR